MLDDHRSLFRAFATRRRCTFALVFAFVAALTVVPFALGGGAAPKAPSAAKIVIRVSSEAPIDVDPLPTAVYWQKLVKKATGGRVEVKIFASAQLFDDTAALDAVASGQLEIALPTTSRITGYAPDFAILDLPFVLPSASIFQAKVQGKLGQALNAKLMKKAPMSVLAYWAGGAIVFLNNEGELTKPSQWKGKKIRIFGGAVFEATVKAVGATPILIPASQVATAMQTGTVNAAITNWDGWKAVFSDIVEYGMDPGAWQLAFGAVVSTKFWDGLPADVRATLTKTLKQATDYDWKVHGKIEADAIAALKKMGKHPYVISAADQKEWTAVTETVRKAYGKKIDPAIFALALAK